MAAARRFTLSVWRVGLRYRASGLDTDTRMAQALVDSSVRRFGGCDVEFRHE
jgi:hypothetical protein